ncbi:MAG: twitching motility protein PilT [Lachnospiraceae bacterium]|nr:twitching motility protein PilT [Lachnospiraceae bacterium]
MVQLIVGEKGKGKTKELLERVNNQVKTASGTICYLDKSTKHMFELNNKVRLINVSDFLINNADQFAGFILGIISQDHDLEQMYLDSFLKISRTEDGDYVSLVQKLDEISKEFKVDFVLSVSLPANSVPAEIKDKVAVAL